MEKRARVTTKGQITIPLEIRRTLGIQTGDDLVFDVTQNGVQVRALRHESPFEKYRGIGNPGLASGRTSAVQAIRALRGR
ncbi:MAG: AbrB/MazE/SpoVT family DNA-binding domain-containing protein [Acidobacteriota bacterium]